MNSVQFKTYIDQLDYLLNVHYLEVPKEIVDDLGGLNNRLICTINEKLSFQCGLVALGEGKGYISINNSRMKKLKLKKGDEIDVQLVKDKSKYGVPVPEEFEELMLQDDEGRRRFEMLPPGKKRYIINYVGSVKSSNLRIERAIMLIENLKKTKEGKETFREILGIVK